MQTNTNKTIANQANKQVQFNNQQTKSTFLAAETLQTKQRTKQHNNTTN